MIHTVNNKPVKSGNFRKVLFFIVLLLSSVSLMTLTANDIDDAWTEILYAYELGDYESVISGADALFEMVTPFPDLYLIRAIAYRDTGYYLEAFEDFDAAEYLEPDNGFVYFHRGYAYLMVNYFNEAVIDFTQAIQYMPDMYEAWWNRGIALNWLGNNRESLQDMNRAIGLIPMQNPYLYRDRGVVLNEMGMYNKALDDYTEAIDIYPDEAIFYAERGLVLQQLGNDLAAVADFDSSILLRQKPNSDDYYNRGVSLARLEFYPEAVENFSMSLSLNPDEVDALINLAWCSIQTGEYENAIASCNEVLILDPEYPTAYFNRAAAKERLHEYESAIQDYEKAIEYALMGVDDSYSSMTDDALAAIEKLRGFLPHDTEE